MQNRKLSFITILLLSIIFLGLFANAQSLERLNTGANTEITKFIICRKVNNASGKDIMIPYNTQVEWTSFINGSITGVTKNFCDCTCPDASVVAFGGTCPDGGICAGTYLGQKYMTTPGNCTNSATPVCDGGADTGHGIAWRGSSGSNADIAGIDNIATAATASTQLGDITTPAMIAAASVSSDSAGHYCNNLVYAGHSDWYLPSKSEMVYLWCNSNLSAGVLGWTPQEQTGCGGNYGLSTALQGFQGSYWTSTEYTSSAAWAVTSNGSNTDYSKSYDMVSFKIRCVRRY